jgi:hypothetical protein
MPAQMLIYIFIYIHKKKIFIILFQINNGLLIILKKNFYLSKTLSLKTKQKN